MMDNRQAAQVQKQGKQSKVKHRQGKIKTKRSIMSGVRVRVNPIERKGVE